MVPVLPHRCRARHLQSMSESTPGPRSLACPSRMPSFAGRNSLRRLNPPAAPLTRGANPHGGSVAINSRREPPPASSAVPPPPLQQRASSKNALLLHVPVDRPEHPHAAQQDDGGAAPKSDNRLLEGGSQVHAEDAGDHRAERRGEAANAQRQLQPLDLRAAPNSTRSVAVESRNSKLWSTESHLPCVVSICTAAPLPPLPNFLPVHAGEDATCSTRCRDAVLNAHF